MSGDVSSSSEPHGADNDNSYGAKLIKSMAKKLVTLLRLRKSTLKESLEEVIEEHDAAGGETIAAEEKNLIRNVLSFSELRVEDVMVPRADVISVDYEATLDDIKKVIVEKTHTRIPVCRGTLDDVAGFVHAKDLVSVLCENKEFEMEEIIRPALFVPPSMKVNDLMLHMRASRTHIALVVDEYGGTSGLVTLEDVMEEIFGEIEDEHDIGENGAYFHPIGKDVYDASARVDIKELEENLGVEILNGHEESFDTLGGMIFDLLGRVPVMGEIVTHPSGLEFEIKEADLRRVKRVIIRKKDVLSSEDSSQLETRE